MAAPLLRGEYLNDCSFSSADSLLPRWRNGRRARFRSVYPHGCGGSSPLLGTIRLAIRLRIARSWQAMYQVYILELIDGSYYVGFTDDLKRRLHEHKLQVACMHTKKIPMRKLLWSEPQADRVKARKREKEIKGWRREKKEALWSMSLS